LPCDEIGYQFARGRGLSQPQIAVSERVEDLPVALQRADDRLGCQVSQDDGRPRLLASERFLARIADHAVTLP
jgi:hypothetical protein